MRRSDYNVNIPSNQPRAAGTDVIFLPSIQPPGLMKMSLRPSKHHQEHQALPQGVKTVHDEVRDPHYISACHMNTAACCP